MIPAVMAVAVVGLVLGPITATLADNPPAGPEPFGPAGARRVSNVLESALVPAGPSDGSGDDGPGGGGPGGGGPGGGPGGGLEVPPGEDPAADPGEGHPIRFDEDSTVTTADGSLTVIVPRSAAPEGSTLYVRALAPGEQPVLGPGLILVDGLMYEILVVDAQGGQVRQFTEPLTLVFRREAGDPPPGAAPDDLLVFYWDDRLGEWIALPSQQSADGRTVTAQVDHLTIFGLLAAPDLSLPVDLRGHWAEADVYKLVSIGAVTGFADGTFRPDRLVTRAEFTVMLARALRIPAADTAPPFRDPIPAWAAGHLAAAVEQGLIGGYDDGTFRPDEPITREAAAALLVRALPLSPGRAGTAGAHPGPAVFADAGNISAWAAGSVALAVRHGLITGFEDGTFRPQGPTTRAQAAVLIGRVLTLRNQ